MRNQGGTLGHGHRSQNLGNQAQSSFQNTNWNGLSPRNRENQVHYQRPRDSSNYDSEDWPESDVEPPVTRKRLGCPLPTNSYPTKRAKQNEAFANQRQMAPPSARNKSFQQYSSTEFHLPPPAENTTRRSAWMGPDIPNGERWGSVEGSGFGQMSSPQILRKQNEYGILFDDRGRNNPITFGGSSGTGFQRGQNMMPEAFRNSPLREIGLSIAPDPFQNSPYRQRGMARIPDGRRGYGGHQVVDLTTPESIHRRRTTTQTSTNSGSSTMRRTTETEFTDIEIDYDSDLQDYKSAQMQTYTTVGGVAQGRSHVPNSQTRLQSGIPDSSNYPSRSGRNSHHGNHCDRPYTNDFVQRESYSVPTLSQLAPTLKTEYKYGQNNPSRNSSRQLMHNNVNRQIVANDDPESDENDTLEEIVRKSSWKKKAKVPQNTSSWVITSKRNGFDGSQYSALGYSGPGSKASNASEKATESSLSRIKSPNTSTPLTNSDASRHVVINKTAARKAQALETETAEFLRQKQAEETIAQRQKRAKELQEYDDLFEEVPADEAVLARIKKSKEFDKAKKDISERAKIIQEGYKATLEKLDVHSKEKLATDQKEYDAAKKQRVEEKRQHENIVEEERMNAKRRSAAEKLRVDRVRKEEARLETRDKLEAEKLASKERAATLQPFKKTNSKPSPAGSGKESETVEDSGNISDGGMFVSKEVVSESDRLPKTQPLVSEDKGVDDKTSDAQKPECTAIGEKPASEQKTETVRHHPDPQSSVEPSTAAKPEAWEDKEPVTARVTSADKQDSVSDAPPNAANASNAMVSNANNAHVTAPTFSGASISAIASDGRRRPPEISKQRVARRASPDPIRFTGSGRTVQNAQGSDHDKSATTSHATKKSQNKSVDKKESRTQAKLQKTLKEVEDLKNKAKLDEAQRKKEWDIRFNQLGEILMQQDREDIAAGKRADSGKNSLSSTSHAKTLSLTSQINFVSTIELQAKQRKKAEEDRLAKYEKDKAVRRKRYDREIRVVLTGQGVEPDDEKVSKQVDEKMATWDENRRKKERRESGGKNIAGSIGQQDYPPASDAKHNPTSPPTLQNTDDEGVKDLGAQKKQERAQAIRAGVEFLASQNKQNNNYAKAASKFRIQDFDSDESEEDPDDEPETQEASAAQPIVEEPEEIVGIEMDETLNPAALDASIIPPRPKTPEPPTSKTAFLPDIVNPREEDMMHSYSVRHRAARGNNLYETVILGSFHSLEEANAFAQEKVSEFYLGPSTGKSETHTAENLYLGQVVTDKDKDHDEIVWVTREIVYIGDTANIKRGDLKPIIMPKVFNVLQVMEDEDGKHVGSVIATASIQTLANKKAVDLFLEIAKPSRPRIDSLAYYNNTVVPAVRQKFAEAEAKDLPMDLEGIIPDTERSLSISVSENLVVGPLN